MSRLRKELPKLEKQLENIVALNDGTTSYPAKAEILFLLRVSFCIFTGLSPPAAPGKLGRPTASLRFPGAILFIRM